MQADYIKDIIKNFEKKLPYRCILFDGAWGIGKTYAIKEALRDSKNVCKISMFGLQNSQQIYHEILVQLFLKENKGKIGKVISDCFEAVSKVWGKAENAKNIMDSILKEKEMLLFLSKKFDTTHIIVIDDLERISDEVNLEEVFGIIEELKQCNYIKVIVVANLEELEDQELFEKFNEKIIDRIYKITEMPKQVNWHKLGIDSKFITEFLSAHKVKNLRTLQKAQNYYNDVELYCKDIENEGLLNEIRLICFAIVVEMTDNLYYKKPDKNEKDSSKKAYAKISNELDYRICRNYLLGIQNKKSVVTALLQYFQNEIESPEEIILAEYQVYLKLGEKSDFYKTDEEMKSTLAEIYQKMMDTDDIMVLLKLADEYMKWSAVLKENSGHMMDEFKIKLHNMLSTESIEEIEKLEEYIDYDMWKISTQEIKDTYRAECKEFKDSRIDHYIEVLSQKVKGIDAQQCSYNLRYLYEHSTYYKGIIKSKIDVLYSINSFPVSMINEKEYYVYFNIMFILLKEDENRFYRCCEEVKEHCDHMSAYRIDRLIKDIKEEHVL